MTNCAACGAFVSRYATIGDRFCWPCHPRIEARYVRVCANGHDLTLHGGATTLPNGKNTSRCMTCKRENDRKTAAYRRAVRKQVEVNE